MLASPLRSLALALAALAFVPACRDRGDATLRRIEMPDAGVAVKWNLDAGQALVGHLRMGSTLQVEGLDDPLDQALECDVTLQIQPGAGEQGAARLRATLSNLELDWGLPPSATYSVDEFVVVAAERLSSAPLWLDVSPSGAVLATSPIPADAPPELVDLMVALTDALASSFVVAPKAATVRRRDTWNDTHARTDGLARRWTITSTAEVEGLFAEREGDRALVSLNAKVQERDPAGQAERDSAVHVLFATLGYVAEIDAETREFSPEAGVVFRKIRATWTRTRSIAPELVGDSPSQDVQVIRDPCNVDYVGPLECEDPSVTTPKPSDDAGEADDAAAEEDAAADDEDDVEADEDAEAPADDDVEDGDDDDDE